MGFSGICGNNYRAAIVYLRTRNEQTLSYGADGHGGVVSDFRRCRERIHYRGNRKISPVRSTI
jgi:hypothetical protein